MNWYAFVFGGLITVFIMVMSYQIPYLVRKGQLHAERDNKREE